MTRVTFFSLLLMKRIILLVVAAAYAANAEIVPPDRRITWNPGIPGGIPTYPVGINAKDPPYNAKGDGVADDTSAIQVALNACQTNKAILLPAGTYKISSLLNVRTRTALRGEGPSRTIIKNTRGGDAIEMRTVQTTDVRSSITAGATKGSKTITLSNADDFSVGQYVTVNMLNDDSLVSIDDCRWCSSGDDGARAMQQIVKITDKNGNDLTISPGLYLDFYNSPQVFRFLSETPLQWAGVENLKIQNTTEGLGNLISMRGVVYCWVNDCELYNLHENGVYLLRSYGCEVRRNYIHHGTSYTSGRSYGILGTWGPSDCLIEDNIFYYLRHSMVLEGGGAGNVFGYNHSTRMFDDYYPNTDWLMGDMLLHGAHPMMNLYEGNVVGALLFDSIHGSASHNTAFRNHIVGEGQGLDRTIIRRLYPVAVEKANYYVNLVGNIFGLPGQTGLYETNNVPNDTTRIVYHLGYDAGNIVGTTADPKVKATLLRHGNYDYITQLTHWDADIPDHQLPNSYYLAGKPRWWGNQPWPAIGPDVPGYVSPIPAKARFDQLLSLKLPAPPTNLRIISTSP